MFREKEIIILITQIRSDNLPGNIIAMLNVLFKVIKYRKNNIQPTMKSILHLL